MVKQAAGWMKERDSEEDTKLFGRQLGFNLKNAALIYTI